MTLIDSVSQKFPPARHGSTHLSVILALGKQEDFPKFEAGCILPPKQNQ